MLRLVTPEQFSSGFGRCRKTGCRSTRGDWTDYWTSGCGSLALETRMMRHAHSAWRTVRALAPHLPGTVADPAMERETLRQLFVSYEHTAGAFCSTAALGPIRQMEPMPVAEQWYQKAACCASALSLARMLRRDLLDHAAGNPAQTRQCEGLLAVESFGDAAAGVLAGAQGNPRQQLPSPRRLQTPLGCHRGPARRHQRRVGRPARFAAARPHRLPDEQVASCIGCARCHRRQRRDRKPPLRPDV